jgi:hypothetical protein
MSPLPITGLAVVRVGRAVEGEAEGEDGSLPLAEPAFQASADEGRQNER